VRQALQRRDPLPPLQHGLVLEPRPHAGPQVSPTFFLSLHCYTLAMSCRRTCRELVGRTVHHPALPLNPSLCSSVFFSSSAILPSSSSANGAALHHHPSSGLEAHRPWRVAATCSRRPELLQQGAVARSSVATPEIPVHVEPASFYAQML
jgi:hypothetical protein